MSNLCRTNDIEAWILPGAAYASSWRAPASRRTGAIYDSAGVAIVQDGNLQVRRGARLPVRSPQAEIERQSGLVKWLTTQRNCRIATPATTIAPLFEFLANRLRIGGLRQGFAPAARGCVKWCILFSTWEFTRLKKRATLISPDASLRSICKANPFESGSSGQGRGVARSDLRISILASCPWSLSHRAHWPVFKRNSMKASFYRESKSLT